MPSAEMMIATMSGSEATAQGSGSPRCHRPVADHQIPGWVPRLARLGRAQCDFSGERAYRVDPLSAGILDSALDATLIAEFNDLNSVRAL